MSLEIYLILGAISFFTSMVTAIFSVGGGMIMLASLGQFVGASALIPLHASVQLLNNISRVYVYKEHINFGILKTILWASFIGSLIAIFIFQNLDEYILTLIIGCSILFLTWVPINKFIKHGLANDLICGLLAGVAGIFIGANGPINGPKKAVAIAAPAIPPAALPTPRPTASALVLPAAIAS